jgi:hypothetical protein
MKPIGFVILSEAPERAKRAEGAESKDLLFERGDR